MKMGRALAVIGVIILALSLAGCYNEFYFFSFMKEQDTLNDEGAWLLTDAGVNSIIDYGLYINSDEATAPLMFRGDFKATVNFWLGATLDKPALVRIMLSSVPPSDEPSDWLSLNMQQLGTEEESMVVMEGHLAEDAELLNLPGEIPGLNKGHWNKLILEKKGSSFKLTINGRKAATFELGLYAAEYFTFNFYSESDIEQNPEDPKLGFIMKDFRVDYSEGNAEAIPTI